VAFYLATFKFMNGAPVWVLVFAQPLVPVLDMIFKAKRFQWKTPKAMNAREEHFLRSVYTHSVM
jgi:hypothetical protein